MRTRQHPAYMADLIALGLLAILHVTIFVVGTDGRRRDPDFYFHMALARQTSEQGLIRTLPQAEDIGWGERFLEKQWLFTTGSGIAYKIGGEDGCEVFACVLGLSFLASLFLLFRRMGVGPWLAMLLYAGPFLMMGPLFSRTMAFRPQLISLLLLSLLLHALWKGKPRWVAFFMMLYAQSYHAIYLPVLILGSYAAARFVLKAKFDNTVLAGLGGLVAGLLLNPYFPYNIFPTINGIAIALNIARIDVNERAVELQILPVDAFIKEMFSCLFALFIVPALVLNFRGRKFGKEKSLFHEDLFATTFWIMALGFGMVAAISPRAVEYSALASVILIAVPFLYREKSKLAFRLTVGLCAFSLIYKAPVVVRNTQGLYTNRDQVLATQITSKAALESIPASESGKKVFNCEWDVASYILYYRPDLRFIDLSDPHLLRVASPEAYELRQLVRDGAAADAWGIVKGKLKSDYVFCSGGATVVDLEDDPNFTRLYPSFSPGNEPVNQRQLFVYSVRSHPVKELLTGYRIKAIAPITSKEYLALAPSQIAYESIVKSPEKDETEIRTPFLEFKKWGEEKKVWEATGRDVAQEHVRNCVWVSPEPWEIARHAGSEVVGIGGGPYVKLFFNGQRYFHSGKSLVAKDLVGIQVPLPRPLAKSDRLDAVVCANPGDGAHGISLSLWTWNGLKELCKEKHASNLEFVDPRFNYAGTSPTTCLGPVAQPNYTGNQSRSES